ncbi:serine hydrolase [Gudongella oleilytica]|uniref:serine hydrolase domain-containing protein n=1 Tax=Gudongella oleilytica TaxID=1582259 RepID=UPI002A36DCD8|nr:serine hydrolase [Gudongella oleilytica]
MIGINYIPVVISSHASDEVFLRHLDELVPRLMNRYDIPGCSLAIVKDGDLFICRSYGYSDREKGIMLTSRDPFRVQSISKSVTAWGVMKLVENGRVDLDSAISSYIDVSGFKDGGNYLESVTVRQLLTHTSGLQLGDVFTVYSPGLRMPSLQEKLRDEVSFINKPGSSFSYSNTGYNLLELLIEEVTGRSFTEYMESEILIPLGMTNSSFDLKESMIPYIPIGYTLKGKPVPAYVYPEKASGGLLSTSRDLARFMIESMKLRSKDDLVLSEDSIDAIHSPQVSDMGIYSLVFDSYALGHYVEELSNGKIALSHGGQGTGIMAHMHFVPESGDGIIILTNSQRSWPFISHLLRDWAVWRDFDPIGMTRIIWGERLLFALVGLVWAAILFQIKRIIGIYKLTNTDNEDLNKTKCCFLILLAFTILVILSWCVNQNYLFIAYLFPTAAVQLGIALFGFSIVIITRVMITYTGIIKKSKEEWFDETGKEI